VSKQIEAIRFTPLPATTGIFMAIFGLGFGVKVEFLAFGIFVYLLPAVTQRIRDIETDDHLKALKQTIWTLNAGTWQSLRHFYIPSVLSRFSMDIINLVAVSWTYIVIAEMINAQGGMGYMIYMATSRGSHVDQLYAILMLIIFIGFTQDKLLKLLDRKLFKFKYA
jgi:NitT/TauT family transport system permease protein